MMPGTSKEATCDAYRALWWEHEKRGEVAPPPYFKWNLIRTQFTPGNWGVACRPLRRSAATS